AGQRHGLRARCRLGLLDVKRHRVDEVHLVAEAGEPERVGAGSAPHVQDSRGRRRELAEDDLPRALPLEREVAFVEPRGFFAAVVEGLDLAVHAHRRVARTIRPIGYHGFMTAIWKGRLTWFWKEWVRPLLVVGIVLGSLRSAV